MRVQKKLKVLFVPISAVGHVNGAIGMAQVLVDSGHEVLFFISDQWKGKIEKYGIKEVLYPVKVDEKVAKMDPAEYWAKMIADMGMLNGLAPLQKMINMNGNNMMLDMTLELDKLGPISS